MRLKTIGYWTATVLVAFPLLSGGAAQFVRQKETVEAIMRLGYPAYFVAILGFWKVLGGIALLAPRFPRLKEWAYAGAFFDLTGAAASHVVCGSVTWRVVMTVVLAALALISWALRPPSRTLGILFPPAPFRRRRKHETETKRPFLSAVDSKRLMGCRWYEAGHRVLVALGW